jgi:biotin-(acetyl-CoA carboxylase) ligase
LADPAEWGLTEYVERCVTIGNDVHWQPDGAGRAVGISPTGGLLVEAGGEVTELVSGAVHEVRTD